MAVGSGEALYIRIDQELQGPISSDSLSCSIFRVPNCLGKINEMSYEPQVISIGPYHRGKDHLKAMEVHKKHYLNMLLDRHKEKTLKDYVEALEGLRENALAYYSEPPDQKGGEDQFVEMMLFDGCFVVELIRKSAMKEFREKNDHLLTHFILRTVMRDLLLIENQLPFFILKKLFDMTKRPNEADQNFMHMAINCFSILMPGPCNKKIENPSGIKHLLGLLHHSCLSPSESPKGVRPPTPEARKGVRPPPPEGRVRLAVRTSWVPCSASPVRFSPTKSEGHEEKNCNWQTIRSASELHEAGIKFEKIEGRLFDIKFEKEVMSIPTLKIVDDTESILRNLVAYEQCYKDISSRYFTDYIRLMDCLINTGKDVELLRHHEVIENRLGDNEVIADIFNRICDSVLIAEEDFLYADLFVKVHKHCKRKWNLWKANLWHNYFNTPWALISFLAAVFLLVLTAMQSIYSALAYYHQNAKPL